MASFQTLLFTLFVVLFGCLYREVSAGCKGTCGKGLCYGYGYGYSKGKSDSQLDKFRPLKFSTIISGRRWCRVQETLGWRLYREKTYCDTEILVTDPTEEQEYTTYKNALESGRSDRPIDRPVDRPFNDNANRSTAVSLTRMQFCAHRSFLTARSKYLESLILARLGGVSSYNVRHVTIDLIDIPPEIFEYILQFIYTYQIDNFNPDRQIIDLFVAANLLQLDDLRDSIREYILHDMKNSIEQMQMIIKYLKWARKHQYPRLERALISMMRRALKLQSDRNWREFGQVICEITNERYLDSLDQAERREEARDEARRREDIRRRDLTSREAPLK